MIKGTLRVFEARYKKHLLLSLLSKIERAESVSELCKEITLLDVINWIAKAWSETAPSTLIKCFKTTGFPVTDEQEDDYEDEDDIPLSLLAQQLRVDQSFLQNVDIEPPTEENTGNWERDLISSFVKPIAEESNKQFVHDDEEKHVDVPGSNLSHREVLDMVIKLKHSSQR